MSKEREYNKKYKSNRKSEGYVRFEAWIKREKRAYARQIFEAIDFDSLDDDAVNRICEGVRGGHSQR
jgi:hypothetical protein